MALRFRRSIRRPREFVYLAVPRDVSTRTDRSPELARDETEALPRVALGGGTMNTCIFCRIIAGEASASVVYEDDVTLAFLDLRQPSVAHVLVIPKLHVETVFDLEPDVAARLMQNVVLTARAISESLVPAGLSIWQSNGQAAGQEVPHVHFHLLTREVGDGLFRIYPERPPHPDQSALDRLAATIRTGFGTL